MSDPAWPLAGVALLFVTCGAPVAPEQTLPAPAVKIEPVTSDRSKEAVPKDSQPPTAPSTAPTPTEPPTSPTPTPPVPPPATPSTPPPSAGLPLAPQVLAASGPGGPLTLHLAAIREGDIALEPLADGALALRGDVGFAIAAPGASPRREPAWMRAIPREAYEPLKPLVFGGRWPDAAFLSFSQELSRSGDGYPMMRWQGERWTDIEPAEEALGFASYHIAYAGGAGGAVLGLRVHVLDTFTDDDFTPGAIRKFEAALRSVRPTVDRLDVAGPTAWPALPPGPVGTGLLSFADGTLVVMRSGPKLQRWTPGATAWKSLPAVGYKATGRHDGPTLVGRDPARLYMFSCPETPEPKPRLHRLTGAAWESIATPDGKCVRSLAEDAGGAVWLVSSGGLYRHVAPGPPPGAAPSAAWEPIALPAVQLPAQPEAWRYDSYESRWRVFPEVAAQRQALTASRVVALGPDDVWISAEAGKDRFDAHTRQVVLTTRPIDAPIVLPDSLRIDHEVHAQDPMPVDDRCSGPLLELGIVTDAPATARPPVLAQPALAKLLEGLAVVSVEVGPRRDVAILWLLELDDHFGVAEARLSPLLEPLRPHFPAVRIICQHPLIVDVLP